MLYNFDNVGHKYKKLIKKIFEKAVEVTNNDIPNIWLTVSFVNRQRIRELNKKYRNIDKVTDVLSFPMLDIVYPQTLNDYKNEYAPDGTLYIGDIVICKKIAKWQAKLYGHSKKREIGFLALHGFLHILGYDHIKKEDEDIMFETSNKILEEVGLGREE